MNLTVEERITEKLKRIKIKDIMTRSVITTGVDEHLSDLADLIIKSKISGVPVVDGNKKMVGIITTTDFLNLMGNIKKSGVKKLGATDGENPRVGSVMTKNVLAVSESHTLWDVVDIMCEKKIHTIPVTKGDQLVGVVGRRDVIMYFYAALRDSTQESNQ